MKSILFTVVITLIPAGLVAQGVCADPSTTLEMRQCASQAFEARDSLLAGLESALLLRFSEGQRTGFREVQDMWEVLRRHDCEFEASMFEGGSIQPVILLSCLSAYTSERIRVLSAFLCSDAGMTGECPEARPYLRRLAAIDAG